MVESIGFHQLLDINCDSVPRGISLWLAKNFDVKSRSLQLAHGSKFLVTPQSIQQALGIPNGGKPICNMRDESLKKLIVEETSCKGKTPTINELKALIIPTLVGDKFKRIFTLFAIGSFLCPSSYDCISTDYYSAVQCPGEIASHDWCTAVLEKLTHSIEFYQKTVKASSTTTLGGCILALVIIYFELLDVPNLTSHEVVPRLKFWSTDMIKAYETLDAKDMDQCIFGRLPLKNHRKTISLPSATPSDPPVGCSKVPSNCISGSCSFKNCFDRMSLDLTNDIMCAIQPILSEYRDRIHAAWHYPEADNELVAEKRVLLDRDKSLLQPGLIAGCMSDIAPQVLHSPVLAKGKDTVTQSFVPENTYCAPSGFSERVPQLLHTAVFAKVKDTVGQLVVPENTSCEHSDFSETVPQLLHNAVLAKVKDSVAQLVVPENTSCEPSDCHATNVECTVFEVESMAPFLQLKREKDKLTMNLQHSNEGRSVSKGHDSMSNIGTSSFVHIPCFNQDSSNTSSYNASPVLSELKPLIQKNVDDKQIVFASQHIASSEVVADTADRNGHSSTSTHDQQPPDFKTPEKSIANIEFDFWGSGIDSDFEVKPPPETVFSEKVDPHSSGRKRPRSLNEAALCFCLSRRLDQGSATKSLRAESMADHSTLEGATSMQSLSAQEIKDVDAIEHMYQSTPSKPFKHHFNFSSTIVKKEVFNGIIDSIPFSGPRPRVVQIRNNWVDHKTFGLSMRVYGAVSSYVIDLMGKAVMTEEYEKNKSNLLPTDFWYRHVVSNEKAKLLQRQGADGQDLSKLFIAPNQGYRLDIMDMIFIPLFYDQFWYLVVANFRSERFEVLLPNQLFEAVKSHADNVILNFKRMFNYACPNSTKVHIWKMDTVYRSVTCSQNHCDSGTFVMKLIKSHDGESQHLFKPEEAKTLRECLSYYLLTHPHNEKFDSLIHIKDILSIHGINRNSYN